MSVSLSRDSLVVGVVLVAGALFAGGVLLEVAPPVAAIVAWVPVVALIAWDRL